MSSIVVDQETCKRDGLCVAVCPMGIIEMKEVESYPSWIDGAEDLCINCGHCVCICPSSALSVNEMYPTQCTEAKNAELPSYTQVDHFLRSRRSIRNFMDQPVDHEVLEALIKTASFAPSGHNLQPVRWLVIEKKEEIGRLTSLVVDWMRETIKNQPELAQSLHMDRVVSAWERGKDRILRESPHLIVAHAEASLRAAEAACHIALTYVELAATSRGLGACWAGYFTAAANSYPPIMKALELPPEHQTFGAMMVGYRIYQYARIPKRKQPEIRWR